jgi:hypothetical protein
MQPSEGCALPRKLLPSPPPWTGNSSIIFGSSSNVVFGPPDAPERPRRDSRVGRHRSIEINAAAVRAPTATGRPDLAMVPTHAVPVCPSRQLSGGGRIWMTFPVAGAATCRGTSAASDPIVTRGAGCRFRWLPRPALPSGRDHRVSGRLHGRRRRGPMPAGLFTNNSRTRHIVE